jgi:transaldolase
MELYLDSADIKEIDEAFKLGFLTGLTTTPTFMHRGGVTNIDKMILDLAKKVPILQVEALGETAEEVVKEAKRQLKMGLKKETTVFKIPVSLEGLRACRMLRNEGIMVNVHLVYTIQQAYMAMQAGASYVCPLVGRLQDQGHDALALVEQCVRAVNYYGYDTKIMFSSVRTVEHVRNAVDLGVHTITVPWKLMKQLTDNHFTAIGTQAVLQGHTPDHHEGEGRALTQQSDREGQRHGERSTGGNDQAWLRCRDGGGFAKARTWASSPMVACVAAWRRRATSSSRRS